MTPLRSRAGRESSRQHRRRGALPLCQLLALLEHVRDGLTRLDRDEIDVFELDELIHHYKRSARELWRFCGQTGSGWGARRADA